MRTLTLAFALLAAQLLSVAPARAERPASLAYDLRLDVPLTVGSAAFWLGGYALAPYLTPERCRWCEDNAFDRRARERLRWSDVESARLLSDLGVVFLTPSVVLGGLALLAMRDGNARESWLDALFVFEAVGLSLVLSQTVKFAVARERPYAHYESYAGQERGPAERVSFYSAHSDIAFALASAAGMVASLRGYRLAPLLWSVGMASATFVAYARVAADVHYLSDVLVGAALGSLIGCAAPWLLHRPESESGLRVSAGLPGVVVTYRR